MALTIHLFDVERVFVAFLRVSQRAFWPKRFFMLISFFFSYSENFFVVFYLSFDFVLGQGPSARVMNPVICTVIRCPSTDRIL